MEKDTKAKKENKIKGLFVRFIEKIDRKMQEQAKDRPCSCSSKKKGDNSCCN